MKTQLMRLTVPHLTKYFLAVNGVTAAITQFHKNGPCSVINNIPNKCALLCAGKIYDLRDVATVNGAGTQQRYFQANENSTIYQAHGVW